MEDVSFLIVDDAIFMRTILKKLLIESDFKVRSEERRVGKECRSR